MKENSNKVTYFAETDGRRKVPFGIKADDRDKHVYVIGKTGMGKSTLLENMAIQDIQNGNGMAFVDPHGKTAEMLLDYVPEERIDDVVYFAPFDMDHPMSFNIMEDVGYDKRHLVANGLMSAFKKLWVDMWSARMEYILSNTIMALLEYPDSTLLGVNRMFTDKVYRKKVVVNITDPSVKSFWVDEFAKYTDRYTQEATPAIQNKIGQFTANPLIRNIIGQPKSSFDLRTLMDEKKIIIINLSKGLIGEGNANLLGSMLITKLYLSAMSRADKQEHEIRQLPNFYLFVDEFQSFANESFADILSEARKYKLNLTIAHQYIEQMPEEVRSAVFGNVGTMIIFRVGAYDAEVLEKEFAPKFCIDDLVNLGIFQIYLKLMINGVSSHPFSATTLPPILPPKESLKNLEIDRSRKLYTKPRIEVQKEIDDWYGQGVSLDKTQTEKIITPKKSTSTPVYKSSPKTVSSTPAYKKTPTSTTSSAPANKSSPKVAPFRSYQNPSHPPVVTSGHNFQYSASSRRLLARARGDEEENKTISKQTTAGFSPKQSQKPRKIIKTETKKNLPQKSFVSQKDIQASVKPSFNSRRQYSQKSQQQIKQQKARVASTHAYRTVTPNKENQIPKAVSLDLLKQETKKTEKPINSNNLKTLKDTLRVVMKKIETSPEQNRGDKYKKQNTNTKIEEKESNKPNKPQEIPKDVLEELLKVKDE